VCDGQDDGDSEYVTPRYTVLSKATLIVHPNVVIARAFQGIAGGGLILLVHVCISDLFSLRSVKTPLEQVVCHSS
jgi:hypothetical protein